MAEFALKAFLTLFVVIDPAGLVPVFVSLAGARPADVQAAIARRAVVIAGGVLLAFSIVGGPLLAYLGISLGALQVAGGILLFRIAIDMVFAQLRRETAAEEAEARSKEDISVFPLAIPLIAGPGALATMLILTSEARGEPAAFGVLRRHHSRRRRSSPRGVPVPSGVEAIGGPARPDGHQRGHPRSRADPCGARGAVRRQRVDRPRTHPGLKNPGIERDPLRHCGPRRSTGYTATAPVKLRTGCERSSTCRIGRSRSRR